LKPEPAKPTAVVLAAGKGERYDGCKQLAPLRGKPLLQHVLDSVNKINWKFKPLLVLGYESEEISSEIDSTGFRPVINEYWKDGMSTSLTLGVDKTPEASSGYLFFLGDMPLVRPSITRKVLRKVAEGGSIVAPTFRGKRGFPVYLHSKWKGSLLDETSGDRGARDLINRNREALTLISTEDRGVIMDVNDKNDLAKIEAYLAKEGAESGV
jgi:CTP:molybdopterin cytidylyltransferase MocA